MRRAAVGVGLVMLVAAGDVVPAHAAVSRRADIRGLLPRRVVPPAPIAVPLPVLPLWWQWPVVMLPEITTSASPRVLDNGPTGGVQLDVVPWSADVYVDGVRAGRVEDFRGYYHHLELPAGPHVIAIFKPGAEPLVANIVIVPGRTLTYRGSLR